MASERDSSGSNDLGLTDFEGLNLSDNTGAKRRHQWYRCPPRLALSANNSFRCSPQYNESSSTFDSASKVCKKRYKKRTGFAKRLPPMGIFWDIENVRVPKMKSATAVVQKIRETFLESYRESEFIVVCDVRKEPPLIIQELHDSQVNLIHVSSTSKNAADEKLRQSLRRFADIHPAPSAILLISGDINFASDLSDLRYRKKIRVILIHNVNVADALILCANEHHSFTTLTEDLPTSYGKKPLELNNFFFLTIANLPKNIDQNKVKNRLKYLTNNCGGKCVEFFAGEGIACLRFGNFDLASRAQNRIQGEDVFGQKIKVLAPSLKSYTGQRVRNVDQSFQQHQGAFNSNIHPLGYQQQFSNLPPPPGFENYSYNPCDMRRKHADSISSLRTPPITLDRMGPPNFRPIQKPGGLSTSINVPSCISPMEMGYEQMQGGFVRRTLQDLGQETLSPFVRVQRTSGSSEYSETDARGHVSNEFSTKAQGNQPVDLNITNLDPTIDVKELRRLLTNIIKEYAMILNLSIIVQADGTPVANLRVSSQQEAQFLISQLHRQKLGHRRILIAYEQNNSTDPEHLKVMVIAVLQDVPDKRMPLFKFMELLESRYLCTVSVSEVNKLKDVVRIIDEKGSRMISLTEEARVSPSHNLSQSMLPYCLIHCPKSMQNIGWCEMNSSFVPNIMIALSLFATKLMTLLNVHFGSMPLLSFQTCYEQEFQEPLPVIENGVPLEHLITCVPNVDIKLVGPIKSIKVVQHDIKPNEENGESQVMKTVAPSLVANVNLLCREVVDLLKNMDRCQILLTKFIPAYHRHFGRQCRVADYGFTKLLDLLETISHVVQIMGDGSRRIITLTHSAQIRRFTSDLLRVLKAQPNKQIVMHEFGNAYERALNKPFNPVEYGLCTLEDLLYEIPENTVVVTRIEEGVFISMPKREQTVEEMMKTKQFADEVIELLRHTPYNTMCFTKFVPSYHHHFGHQCKVSDYGFTKLIELFEAIPDVVEIKETSTGDRTISLTLQHSLKILGSQLLQVVRNAGSDGGLKMEELPFLYFREFGYPLNLKVYNCETLEEVVHKLSEFVQVVHSNAGSLLRPVEMETSPNILRVRCWALLLCPPHVKDLYAFRYEYRQCYNNNFSMETLRDISNVVSLSTMNNTDFISLTSLYVLAAQLYYVIGNHDGSIEYNQLEKVYENYYSKQLKLSSFNINSVNEFYNQFNLIFYIRGSKKRSVVVLNRNLQEQITFKCDNATQIFTDQTLDSQWTFVDASQGAVKRYSVPKPDTPPTPGSTLWWNSPSKFEQQSMNFTINMPIKLDQPLMNQSEILSSPTWHLLAIDNPWNNHVTSAAPEPHELPLPDKLLTKGGVSDDSGDSGVNIMLENSPSDNELEPSSSKNQGAIKKKPSYGILFDFK